MRAVLLTAVALACGVGSPRAGLGQGAVAPIDSIVLERTLCFGTCPAYRLSLTHSGRVHFESRNPGDSGRTASDTIAPSVVADLAQRALASGFFDLPEVIARDPHLCADSATDHPMVTITIFPAGDSKRVVDYRGCYKAADHSQVDAVKRLRAFEAAIDSAAGSVRWIRPARHR